jgi:hypothetical protein
MARARAVRIVGPGVRVALPTLLALWAVYFLFGTIMAEGAGPATVFGLLVLAAAMALLWRATLDLRKALRRLRS